jgi:hypothetical protein
MVEAVNPFAPGLVECPRDWERVRQPQARDPSRFSPMAVVAVTHDDPFIIQANITRLRSLLQIGTDEPTRLVIRRVLAEFEACAALPSNSGRAENIIRARQLLQISEPPQQPDDTDCADRGEVQPSVLSGIVPLRWIE